MQNGAVILNPNGKLYYYGQYVVDMMSMDPLKKNNEAIYNNPVHITIARDNNVGTTQKLLQYKDGTCDAWGFFFEDVLEVQGITSQMKKITPVPNPGILAPKSPQGTTLALGIHNLHSNIAYAAGKGSHHGVLPKERIFEYHVIVQYGDAYYDPSYGEKYGGISSGAARLALAKGIESYGIVIGGKYNGNSIPGYYWQQPEYFGVYIEQNSGANAAVGWININNY